MDGEGQRHHTTGAWRELGSPPPPVLPDSNQKYIAASQLSWSELRAHAHR